jgi:N-formylglutamate deformylase
MDLFRFSPGSTPLLVSIPHAGTHVPEALYERLTAAARELPDTDWHVDRLYDFAAELGAGMLVATHSRYVVDLNRPPDDAPLYPGAHGTGLCPTTLFNGTALYLPGRVTDAIEVSERLDQYWRPYHEQLAAELARLRAEHGVALLFDAHSIRSVVPRLFEGRLPDLNLGTAGGASAAETLQERLFEVCKAADGYSSVLNGRFTGGYTTRHYGDPANSIHAVQLELAQATYMAEYPPFEYEETLAESLRPVLRRLLEAMRDWASEATA